VIAKLINFREILVIALIFIPLEMLLPIRRDQRCFRRHWFNDIIYMFANGILVQFGLILLIVAVVTWGGPVEPNGFVAHQPLWLQVIAAYVIADAGVYAAHRSFHAVPWLWRFHSVHHSIEELDWLATHRVHAADQIILAAAVYLPLFLLGFSVEAIAIHALIYTGQSYLLHSNVRINIGPLRHILATPHFHHWHHANHVEAWDRNFAPSLTWLDRLFGTLHLPDAAPTRFGTDDPVPPDFVRQFAWPFVRRQRPDVAPTGVTVP
jgi:sterol desaturase/sphingolipid hydroxylase (fatty acid hydroxylase superfamily)